MPIHSNPTIPSVVFTVGSLFIVVGLLMWWLVAKEYRHGPALPIIFLGTAISALVVEPIFDNTLLYWYPPDNDLGVYGAVSTFAQERQACVVADSFETYDAIRGVIARGRAARADTTALHPVVALTTARIATFSFASGRGEPEKRSGSD